MASLAFSFNPVLLLFSGQAEIRNGLWLDNVLLVVLVVLVTQSHINP